MNVELITDLDTNKAINKVYVAARTCYSKESPIEIWNHIKNNNSAEEIAKRVKLIKHVLNSGHLSVIEHLNFMFLIEGVSRSLTHQLMRHRVGVSYSQQSQRYCKSDEDLEVVVPKAIENNPDALEGFKATMKMLGGVYSVLIGIGIKPEDARAVLPNACCTNVTLTINARALIHLCNERLCTCAQEEIRSLVYKMANAVSKDYPFLKEYLVPKCEMLGYCNESGDRSCGRKKLKKDVL